MKNDNPNSASGKRWTWLALCLLSSLLFTCSNDDGKKDIRDYYFPIRQLEDGLVYEYRAVGQDSLPPIYWYYRSFIEEEGVFLTGTYYEFDLIPRQLAKEEVVSNGIIQNELDIFVMDSTGRQQPLHTEVLSGSVFPFKVSAEGGIFLYKIQISAPDEPHLVTTLIKNRRYVGDTTYVFQDTKLPSVIFEVRELVELDDKEQGGMEPQWDGTEIYAKNIGLVYYEKQLGETPLTYALFDRYPMTVLEEKFKQMLTSEDTYEQN